MLCWTLDLNLRLQLDTIHSRYRFSVRAWNSPDQIPSYPVVVAEHDFQIRMCNSFGEDSSFHLYTFYCAKRCSPRRPQGVRKTDRRHSHTEYERFHKKIHSVQNCLIFFFCKFSAISAFTWHRSGPFESRVLAFYFNYPFVVRTLLSNVFDCATKFFIQELKFHILTLKKTNRAFYSIQCISKTV